LESDSKLPIENAGSEPVTESRGDDSICVFGAVPLVQSARGVRNEFVAVRQSEDIEAIHRIRVASRRLRTALQLFKDCLPSKKTNLWNNQIRSLTRALGKARDIDVQCSLITGLYKEITDDKLKPGFRRILLRINQTRQKVQTEVNASIEKLERSKILDQIEKRFQSLAENSPTVDFHTLSLYQLSCDRINQRLNDLLAYEVYIRRPEYKDELHMMRIAAKRLRYTMEIFAQLYEDKLENALQATRKTQTLIGEIHDCDVWIDFLPEFYESEQKRMQKFYGHTRPLHHLLPGLEYFKINRQQERVRLYEQFLKNWHNWNQKEIWINLRETILISIPPSDQSSPPIDQPPITGQ
jgi:CHAD domain-containing protein